MDFSRAMSAETKTKGDELFFKLCPYCEGGRKDKDTFSINLKNGTFNCFRSSCGKHGHFVELARDFNYILDFKDNSKTKVYKKLPQKPIKTKPKAVEYLESRGISEAITERYNITTHKDNDNILVFPFYDESGVLTFIKYRNCNYDGTGSKEWCEKDTKPILFGMNHCVGFERLIITEGQIDSLSISECGIKNAVSVPTGALGFTFLEHVWEWITKFNEIIVFGDNEGAKVTLFDTLQKRLPCAVKCVQIPDYLGEKDANQILTKYGKQSIITALNNAKIQPLKNVKELADVQSVDIYTLPRIYTNIQEVDRMIGGLFFGQVVIITGKAGEGKSTFMSQLIVEAIDQNYSVWAYSGELVDYHFKRWIDLQCAGPDGIKISQNQWGENSYYIEQNVIDKINNWYRGKAYIYDNNCVDDDELESLLVTIEKSICRYGIKLVCIDNLMTALDVSMSDDLYRAQSKFVQGCKTLAMKHNVVIILVAHPKKMKGDFDNDDVSGSSDITKRVDVVMSYSQNNDNAVNCDSKLAITKNRLLGKLTKKGEEIQFYYSESTKRISSKSSDTKHYGWEAINGFMPVDIPYDDLPFD